MERYAIEKEFKEQEFGQLSWADFFRIQNTLSVQTFYKR